MAARRGEHMIRRAIIVGTHATSGPKIARLEDEMTSRSISSEDARKRAQASFDKVEQRKQGVARALDAERAEQESIAKKTLRLRALRLAKENADMIAAADLKALAPPPKTTSRAKAAAKPVAKGPGVRKPVAAR